MAKQSRLLGRIVGVFTCTPTISHLHFQYRPFPIRLNRLLTKKNAKAIAVSGILGEQASEAICARRPVIAYTVGGLGEALGDGECGVLMDMQDFDNVVDVCDRLLMYPELVDSAVIRAWEFASKLTIDKNLRRLCEVYDDIFFDSSADYLCNSEK